MAGAEFQWTTVLWWITTTGYHLVWCQQCLINGYHAAQDHCAASEAFCALSDDADEQVTSSVTVQRYSSSTSCHQRHHSWAGDDDNNINISNNCCKITNSVGTYQSHEEVTFQLVEFLHTHVSRRCPLIIQDTLLLTLVMQELGRHHLMTTSSTDNKSHSSYHSKRQWLQVMPDAHR